MMDLYDSQRSMRHMRKLAIQRGVVAIWDVGSSKIACLVLRFDGITHDGENGDIGSLAGQSGFRVIGAATTRSRGVRFGEICAMGETERAIRTALQAAQKMAGIRVDHVIACFSGGEPRSYGLAQRWGRHGGGDGWCGCRGQQGGAAHRDHGAGAAGQGGKTGQEIVGLGIVR